jgi:predicted DNA-binding transcriptional regulator AlpA
VDLVERPNSIPAGADGLHRLVGHLADLAQAAARVAEDLRSGLADPSGGEPDANVPTQPTAVPEALLDAKQVARLFGIGVRTLRRWRHEGRAPRPLKGDGPLRWRRADVDRWLKERAS